MTIEETAARSPVRPSGLVAGVRLRAVSAVLSIAILAVSAWNIFLNNGTHQDVSWLLTVGEKLLSGQKLYADVIETNPPFSVYLYLPMVWLGTVTPLSAELWTKIATYIWILFFGAAALHTARRLRLLGASEAAILVPVGIYAFLLLSPYTFSQREHFAAASALPMLVLAGWRMTAGSPGRLRVGWILLAGIGAAATMMVKPHYALVFLLPYLLAAWSARSLRVVFALEVIAAAVVVIAYGAAVWVFHPLYLTQMVPLLLDVYAFRRSLPVLIFALDWEQLVLGGALAVLFMTVAPRRENTLAYALGAGAFGFFCAFLLIGKGWPYHSMPGLVLTLIAIAIAGARWALAEIEKNGEIPVNAAFIAVIVAAGMAVSQTALSWSVYKPPAAMVSKLNAVVEKPVVASVSHDIGTGHPWARSLGGTWIEQMCSEWLIMGGEYALRDPQLPAADRQRIEMRMDEAVARKVADWKASPPDIVFLDIDPIRSIAALLENPDLAQLLENYDTVFEDERVRIALRVDLLPAWQAANATVSSPGAASD
ncbi:hypothetical protein [uncultured Nitratireductor sp.]|uniref:hypothetical protein n=1 Tax=uncultured Nitratireductor sp. TaxID=520953 RepID=UPI0025CBBB9E|nr:hypothetical protein [uncultured Nitratireductor sp.]